MTTLPLIRASQLAPFVAASERLGIPTRRHLEAVHLPESSLERPGQMIARRQLWNLADRISQREGLPDFGLHAATTDPVSQLGAFGQRLGFIPERWTRCGSDDIGLHADECAFELVRCQCP